MEKKSFAGRIEVKFAEANGASAREFSGYGAVFGNVDFYDDIIVPGAFAATIAEHKAAGSFPAMLWNHDAAAMPIGVWNSIDEDDHGLKVSGHFLDTVAGRDAYTIAKAGAVTGLSIGYIVTAFEVEKRDGKTVRIITAAKLMEVSLVTFPANDLARVSDVKSQKENEMNVKMQRKSLDRLRELFAEADDLLSKFGEEPESEEAAGDEAVEDEVEADDEADETEAEAKYNQAAFEAVRNLTLMFKNMEKHG